MDDEPKTTFPVRVMGLKTIEQHDADRRKERAEREAAMARTGVACPRCGGELLWQSGGYCQTLQYPPPTTAPACCAPCGLTVMIER